ncbi:MAG: hypothetical protein NW224_16335 [Leptolyngbyaceae cyanobacterium bins.302]|nr:hypothetical protein [Leptolyngbyaceae cyanobacterium bins.302]
MLWRWKLNTLMEERGIESTKILLSRIRAKYPQVVGNFGESTARLMLAGNLDRINQTGLIVVCQFFHLKSLSQLVDFADAPDPGDKRWSRAPKLELVFKLQQKLLEKDIPQMQVAEEGQIRAKALESQNGKANQMDVIQSKVSLKTINSICRGRVGNIAFTTLGAIADSLRAITFDYEEFTCEPITITELIDIQPIKEPKTSAPSYSPTITTRIPAVPSERSSNSGHQATHTKQI